MSLAGVWGAEPHGLALDFALDLNLLTYAMRGVKSMPLRLAAS